MDANPQQSQGQIEEKKMTVPLIDKQVKNSRNMPTMLFIVNKYFYIFNYFLFLIFKSNNILIGKYPRIC